MELWIIEFRTRERKNGKWAEWNTFDAGAITVQAFRVYPSHRVFKEAKYETRAVEYVPKEVR